jgi:hypothetical protein
MISQINTDMNSLTMSQSNSIPQKKKKTKFVFCKPKSHSVSKPNEVTQSSIKLPPNADYGNEKRTLNKKLEKALKAGRVADTKKYILEGAAISFLNFDGILSAAEGGKYKVIEMIFTDLDYTKLIARDIIDEMIMSTGTDMMDHPKLHKFLLKYRDLCPDTIENENLDGFIDDIACKKECNDI